MQQAHVHPVFGVVESVVAAVVAEFGLKKNPPVGFDSSPFCCPVVADVPKKKPLEAGGGEREVLYQRLEPRPMRT